MSFAIFSGSVMPAIEKFLIVDDQDSNLLFFQVLLGEMGYQSVFTANYGHDALTSAERFGAQFIISSWELSGMPGTALVQRLKSDRRFYHMPFFIYSKNITESEKALLAELGMNEVLTMPFDREKAKSMIQEIIDREAALTSDEKKFRAMQAAFATNDLEAALKVVNGRLVSASDIAYKVNTLLGEIYLAMGAPKKSEEHLMSAQKQNNDYLPMKHALAQLYSATNRHDQAVQILKDMASSSPLNIQTMLSLGSAYLMSGSTDKAKDMIAKAEKIDSDCSDVLNEKAKVSFSEGDLETTKTLITQSGNGNQLARDFNNMAIALVANKEYKKALQIYSQAIEILSNKVNTYLLQYNLGLAYRKFGKLERAFEEFAKSYISQPEYEKAYSAIARVFKEMKANKLKPDQSLVDKIKAARATVKSAEIAKVSESAEASAATDKAS